MFRALLACLCLVAPAATAAGDDAPSLAWIVTGKAKGVATLDVYASFPQAGGARYSLAIEKRGAGGQASTRHTGTFDARAAGVARVLHNTHSFDAGDRIVIDLTYTAADGTEGHERITLGAP